MPAEKSPDKLLITIKAISTDKASDKAVSYHGMKTSNPCISARYPAGHSQGPRTQLREDGKDLSHMNQTERRELPLTKTTLPFARRRAADSVFSLRK